MTFLDLPHASLPYGSQIRVLLLIPSKTVNNGSVENTALSPDEEPSPGAACCGDGGGIWTTLSRDWGGAHLATLRHFDTLHPRMVKYGPLIPCERRLVKMEI